MNSKKQFEQDARVTYLKGLLNSTLLYMLFICLVIIQYNRDPELFVKYLNEDLGYLIIVIIIFLGILFSPKIPSLARRTEIIVSIDENKIQVERGKELYFTNWEDVEKITHKPIIKRLWSIKSRDGNEIYIPKWVFSKKDEEEILNLLQHKSEQLGFIIVL